MVKGLYVVLAVLILTGYGWAGFRGLELSTTRKGIAQQGVRGAVGGSRTFWHGGYRGGK